MVLNLLRFGRGERVHRVPVVEMGSLPSKVLLVELLRSMFGSRLGVNAELLLHSKPVVLERRVVLDFEIMRTNAILFVGGFNVMREKYGSFDTLVSPHSEVARSGLITLTRLLNNVEAVRGLTIVIQVPTSLSASLLHIRTPILYDSMNASTRIGFIPGIHRLQLEKLEDTMSPFTFISVDYRRIEETEKGDEEKSKVKVRKELYAYIYDSFITTLLYMATDNLVKDLISKWYS